jgi:hypothetical protein
VSTQTIPIKTKAEEYKKDIRTLEQSMKEWREARVRKISEAADNCYDAFNDFQMALTKLKSKNDHKNDYDKYQLLCYRETYEFLEFVENKVRPDWCTFLLNASASFSRLIEHYSKYCTETEKKYDIKLNSERELSDQ